MSRSIRNYHDAEGKPIQAYYAAYMIEHGFSTPEQAWAASGDNNADYLIWNQDRWAEFERETRRPHDGPRITYAREFADWLQARCDQIVAQSEAA